MNRLKLVAVLLLTAMAILSPLGLVWALNTLFPPLHVPYTPQTWLACWIIYAVIKASHHTPRATAGPVG